jgi:hypothetical protein
VSFLERCVCGDIGDSWRDISENEQHGDTTGMSVVMVHRIFNHRVLVLPRRVVVSTVTIRSALFDTRFENWKPQAISLLIYTTRAMQLWIQMPK